MTTNVAATIFSSRAQPTHRGEGLARRRRRLGRRLHFRREHLVDEERQEARQTSVGATEATSHDPKETWKPCRLPDLRPEGVARHRREPERRGERQRRHRRRTSGTRPSSCGSHRPASIPRPRRARAPAGRERRSGPCRWERRARRPRRRRRCCIRGRASSLPNRLTTRWPSRCPSPHFTMALRNEERDDDQQDRPVREPGVGLRGSQDSGEDGDPPRRGRKPSGSGTRRRSRTRSSPRRSRRGATPGAVRPSGTGQNQIATPRASTAPRARSFFPAGLIAEPPPEWGPATARPAGRVPRRSRPSPGTRRRRPRRRTSTRR